MNIIYFTGRVNYLKIHSDETSSDFGWTKQIGEKIYRINHDFIIVGHSFGVSMILKYLSENPVSKIIKGIFLVATPFWDGNAEWEAGFKLKDNLLINYLMKFPFFLSL